MRTRAQGRASPDPQPVVKAPPKRRKRRAPSDHADRPQHEYSGDDEASIAAQTPAKAVKRVRFSDLGPELMQSTGLTPFVRRATLSPTYATPSKTVSPRNRRRFSLPPSLPSSSVNPLPSIEEIQFTPLRQVLNERLKRRLRRSHLSEELNEIQAEQRDESRTRSELLRLRTQDFEKEQTIKQLLLDLELQRMLGIEVNAEEEQEINDLKCELDSLKRERALASDGKITHSTVLEDEQADDAVPSPWEEETFFSSPIRPAGGDMESPLAHTKSGRLSKCFDASCQTALPDHNHSKQIQEFEEAVSRLTKESTDAKTSLELIWSELRNLGFAVDTDSNEDLLLALRESFRATRLKLEYLLPGETSGGTDQGNLLLDSMISHIQKLVQKREESKKVISRHEQIESALRGQFNATVQKAADLEQRLAVVESHRTALIREMESKGDEMQGSKREIEEKAIEIAECKQRIAQLEAEAQEQATSVDRLQAALVTYRDEVTSLETLITKVEQRNAQKETDLSSVRSELSTAVAAREVMSQTLAKLRQDVQESAFELSALATPGIKENVTLRKVAAGKKRDSGVAMSDNVDAMEQ